MRKRRLFVWLYQTVNPCLPFILLLPRPRTQWRLPPHIPHPDSTTRNIKQRRLSLSLHMLHILLRERKRRVQKYRGIRSWVLDAEMLKGCFASFHECDIHKAIVSSLIVIYARFFYAVVTIFIVQTSKIKHFRLSARQSLPRSNPTPFSLFNPTLCDFLVNARTISLWTVHCQGLLRHFSTWAWIAKLSIF